MKLFVAALLVVLSGCAAHQDKDAWLNAPEPNLLATSKSQRLSDSKFFEITSPHIEGALRSLAQRPIILLSQGEAEVFGGKGYRCGEGSKPYLVRAVYQNRGTGSFSAERIGSALWINHGSLGRPSDTGRSALLVCMNSKPTELFVTVSGAM